MKMTLGLILFSALTFADANHVPISPEAPEFKIEKGLLEDFYQSNIEEAHRQSNDRAGTVVEVTPSFSLLSVSTLQLSNNYFEVPYQAGGATSQIPMVGFSFGTSLARAYGFEVYSLLKAAYSYREALVEVRSRSRTKAVRDVMTLQWIPLTASLKLSYRIPRFSYIVPSLIGGAGAEWLSQEGKQDGINQGFWIPFHVWGAMLTFFDRRPEQWFGGVSLSYTTHKSFSSVQRIDLTAFEVGTSFVF